MFNSISGTITYKNTNSLFIENSGIEWDFFVPSLSLDSFGTLGSETKVYAWLYHREDAMRLFGFTSVHERDLFIDLMKVDGIGPKQAIKILSSIPVNDLEAALDAEDLGRLESAPGIGKKTAQKMILALKGKLTHIDDSPSRRPQDKKAEHEDIVVALTNMGFDRKMAIGAVEDAVRDLKTSALTGSANGVSGETASTVASSGAGKALEQEIFRRAIVALSS